jgi:hydroxymethylglutaryl-CoA reductase
MKRARGQVSDGAEGSRIPGFYKLTMEDRVRTLAALAGLDDADVAVLSTEGALPREVADRMIENAVGSIEIPLGIGLNLRVNGRDHLVPMAIEEPSVLAAVSFASRLVRASGGFTASTDAQWMAAQIQLTRYGDPEVARAKILAAREAVLALADSFHPSLVRRGGGARELEVRVLPAPEGDGGEPVLVAQILIDVLDAMGANLVNTVAEGVAPLIESLTGGVVALRILTNLADRRLARARCEVPVASLAHGAHDGEAVCEGVVQASRFAEADAYRAATHNKGIMNGIDAVAIATGNDWRAIEAGAHAWAARDGRYRPLSVWRRDGDKLVGTIELPLQVGTVGGPIRVHPVTKVALKVLRVKGARELAEVMAAVGLAQNLAALRALGSTGIQEGHMALHARCVAVTAGARGADVERLAGLLVDAHQVKVEKAKELLAALCASGQTGDPRSRVTE